MDSAQDLNFLERKAHDWAIKVRTLHNTPVAPQHEGEKRTLLNFAKKIKDNIEAVTGNIPALDPIDELGIWPLAFGVVGVSAALAAITKWTLDYKKFMVKVNETNKLIARGHSPQQAAEIVRGLDPQQRGFFDIDFKQLAMPALIIGGLIWYQRSKK